MTLTPPPPDRFLRLPDVQSAVGLRRAMIYRTIAEGRFPRPTKLGRISAWSENEVLAWIEARKAERNAA